MLATSKYTPFTTLSIATGYFCKSEFRYFFSFNGQERDDEIAGVGNIMTAEFWEYDARLGRRWNLDPVTKVFQSPYSVFSNNPIWFVDINGDDTTIVGVIFGQSEIKDAPTNPGSVPTGVKLESFTTLKARIENGKFTQVEVNVTPKEFESPVLGGIKPAFTRINDFKVTYSEDKSKAYIHYEVQTQLSAFEVVGQWLIPGALSGNFQTNIITVTQSVDIVLEMGSITTTFDASTFPETRYNASYIVNTGEEKKTAALKWTLQQSTYEDAIHASTFREYNHPQKSRQKLTY